MVKLADVCKERHISVERLAAETGTSASNIRSLLAGASKPRIDLALRIARYLDIPVESIEWGKPSDDDTGKERPVAVA